jgi:osmotically-inducible protein OsmY
VAEGAALVERALENPRYQSSVETMNEIRGANLTTQCRAALLAHPDTRALEVRVVCEGGQVTVSGMVEHDDQRQLVEQVIAKVPGVTAVSNNIVVRMRITASSL